VRPILKLPKSARDQPPSDRTAGEHPAPEPSSAGRNRRDSSERLQQLISLALWPIVEAAFRDVDDEVDSRFYRIADLQVVVSRAPVREVTRRHADRVVTLEVWPPVGRRLLVVDWSGRRPYVVHCRDGDWLPRLIRASRQLQHPEWMLAQRADDPRE
jgi:hypothetical protein